MFSSEAKSKTFVDDHSASRENITKIVQPLIAEVETKSMFTTTSSEKKKGKANEEEKEETKFTKMEVQADLRHEEMGKALGAL